MRRFLIALCLFATTAAAEEYKRGEIIDGIVTATDPVINYACYLPSNYTADRRWPILYIFDPRTRGAFAAGLFREAAEQYGWILVSSNNTRSDSDTAPNVRALEATIPDAQKRFSVDTRRIYATGFSGGAILAWAVGLTEESVAGVIGASGRPVDPSSSEYRVRFDWYGTAGTRDFNYLETMTLDRGIARANGGHRVEIFDGGHRWAPPEILKRGVEWLEVQAMKRGLRQRDDAIIKALFDADLATAQADADPLSAVRRYETIVRTFDGLVNVDDATKRAGDLRESPEYRKAADEESRAEKLERTTLPRIFAVMNSFLRADESPLAPTLAHELQISRLQKLAAKTGYEAAAAQRLLESIFVQVDFYFARQVSGQKLVVLKQVSALIHPPQR